MTQVRLLLPIVLLSLLTLSAQADVTLNGMFTDTMVLQRGMEVSVWGFADAGEDVTVSACGQSKTATADPDGRWMIRLDPIEVTEPFTVTVSGNNEIVLQNVVMGEVWICSGQSNMAWVVRNSINGEQEVAEAEYPLIRLCQIPRRLHECGRWPAARFPGAEGVSASSLSSFFPQAPSASADKPIEIGIPDISEETFLSQS